MFYEFLGSYLDLSAVVSVAEKSATNAYDRHHIFVQFADMIEPYDVKVNPYYEWEMDRAKQAVGYIREELARRGPVVMADRPERSFDFDGDAIDLSKIRAISSVHRDIFNDQQGGKKLSFSEVRFDFEVAIAGRAPIIKRLTVYRDVSASPLHAQHEKLLRRWMATMGWRDVA